MGQFLQIGIANELYVPKKMKRWNTLFTREEIEEKLQAQINIQLYDFVEEDEEGYSWKLNQEIFVKNIEAFLDEQLKLMGEVMSDELKQLLQSADYEKMMIVAREKRYAEFQTLEQWHGYLLKDLDVWSETIVFYYGDKAYLECYYNLFRYMGQLIRRASTNTLKDTVVIALQ